MKKISYPLITALLLFFALSCPIALAKPSGKESNSSNKNDKNDKNDDNNDDNNDKKKNDKNKKKKKNDNEPDKKAAGIAAAAFDVNKNKIIDGDEIQAINEALSTNPKTPIKFFDKNDDNKLSAEELSEIIIIEEDKN